MEKIFESLIFKKKFLQHSDMTEEMTKETIEVIVGACDKHPSNNEVGWLLE